MTFDPAEDMADSCSVAGGIGGYGTDTDTVRETANEDNDSDYGSYDRKKAAAAPDGLYFARLERKTLIQEAVALRLRAHRPASVPPIKELDDRANSPGQANQFQLKSDLHLGKLHRDDYSMGALHHGFICWCWN